MRDDAKKQLDAVNKRIEKSKDSLEQMRDVDEIKTLSMEFVDIIPLGQFRENDLELSKNKDLK